MLDGLTLIWMVYWIQMHVERMERLLMNEWSKNISDDLQYDIALLHHEKNLISPEIAMTTHFHKRQGVRVI